MTPKGRKESSRPEQELKVMCFVFRTAIFGSCNTTPLKYKLFYTDHMIYGLLLRLQHNPLKTAFFSVKGHP